MMFGQFAHWSHQMPLTIHFRDSLGQTWGRLGVSESAPKSEFLVGVSVGQGAQATGVAVLERFSVRVPGAGRHYACRYLRRWVPPDTAYPALVSHLSDMFSDPSLKRAD